jgi:hypothetical protein
MNDLVAKRTIACSQLDNWPLLLFAAGHVLPVQFQPESGRVWQNFKILQGKIVESNFDPEAKDITVELNKFKDFAPQNILNWSFDQSLNVAHYTNDNWGVVLDGAINLVGSSAPAASKAIALQGTKDVGKIQVGDVIATAYIDGWPLRQDKAGHSDVIAAIKKSTLTNSLVTLDTEVYLMYNSSHDGDKNDKIGVWKTIRELVQAGNHDFNWTSLYVIRSLDFAAFNAMYDA